MKTLGKFSHINAVSVAEAVAALRRHGAKAAVLAGGTDLVGTLRFEVLPEYPEVLINLKSIPGLDYLKEEDGVLKIGALTRLEDIANSPLTKSRFPALSEAARRTASPHVRVMGTIGGNICQLIRCWYFRKEDNRFDCLRKGGKMCHAGLGDNRYHSIFGAVRVGVPPCSTGCLGRVDIPSYLSEIRAGRLAEAARILLDRNPLPAVTGRVCPHYCEQECNRGEFDEALSVRSIERFMGDYVLANAGKFYRAARRLSDKIVAIVGSGPAGLSAAYFLRTLGSQVTVFEEAEEPGGILTYGIPPYRLQKDVVRNQIQALEGMGVQFKPGSRIGRDLKLEDLRRDFGAVFLATGAWQQPSLNIEGGELLTSGLDFLNRVNRGLRKIPSRKVLVIGGGRVAIDVAITARRMGVEDVTIACLESEKEMPALPQEVGQAIKEGAHLMNSWGPSRVIKRDGKLAGLELVRCTRVYDSSGNFSPTFDNATKEVVLADEIILAIGQKPDLSFLGETVNLRRGMLEVDPDTQATSLSGVFAGGDAATSSVPASVIAAVAAGRRAALAINRYMGGRATLNTRAQLEHLVRADSEHLEKIARVKTPELPAAERSLEAEDILGLAPKAVESEANRCFNCGCDGVNPSDMAAALVALDARIVTSRRTLSPEEFWTAEQGQKSTALAADEIVTEIQIPVPAPGVKSSFIKFALRKSIDFPIVNCAAAIESQDGLVKSARICLNAVYSNPYRAVKAEEAMVGQPINEETAEAAGAAAVSAAIPLPYNKFKVQIAKTLVKRAILACR